MWTRASRTLSPSSKGMSGARASNLQVWKPAPLNRGVAKEAAKAAKEQAKLKEDQASVCKSELEPEEPVDGDWDASEEDW